MIKFSLSTYKYIVTMFFFYGIIIDRYYIQKKITS